MCRVLVAELRCRLVCALLEHIGESALRTRCESSLQESGPAPLVATELAERLTRFAKQDGRHLDERVGPVNISALVRAGISTTRADTTRPAVTDSLVVLAQLLLDSCDLQQILDHQALTATCLLAAVTPFPLVDQSVVDILAGSDATCRYVPYDERFAAFQETFMSLVDEWYDSPHELLRTASLLSAVTQR